MATIVLANMSVVSRETTLERADFVDVSYSLRGKESVHYFLSTHFWSAVVSAILSKDRLNLFKPGKLKQTGT